MNIRSRLQAVLYSLLVITVLPACGSSEQDAAQQSDQPMRAGPLQPTADTPLPTPQSPIDGTGTLFGKLTAEGAGFEAARIFARSDDRLYQAFSAGGEYELPALVPGTYEVWAEVMGLQSKFHTVGIGVDATVNLDLELMPRDPEPRRQGGFLGVQNAGMEAALVPYNELYPPHPARELLEQTCIACHQHILLGVTHKTKAEWAASIERMMTPGRRGRAWIPEGVLSAEQADMIAEYLGEHFGPESTNRLLEVTEEIPVDEAVLADALYLEYFLPLNEKHPKRTVQDVVLDPGGSVWYTDRNVPNVIGKLDPRTGEFTEYDLPDPEADPHGITVDSAGQVFWMETRSKHMGRLNPATGEITRYNLDPENTVKGPFAGHTPILDEQENVWFTVIMGDSIGKWDRATEKVTLWTVPTRMALPYFPAFDKQGRFWFTEFMACKIARFDPATESFTEYPLPLPVCTVRGIDVDSQGLVWFSLPQPSHIGSLDPSDGTIKLYATPSPRSEPYDLWVDKAGDIWFGDSGLGAAIVRFNRDDESFDFYPAPRPSDMPKSDMTEHGAIWYSTRALFDASIGVLYPQVSGMDSFSGTPAE